ncbi:MAG: HlyD family efflux transporter periplasmic adaptor subunit [Pirellulaceae bacterium]|nr:HlyD family efflux transporter periplasmic adaptor subunit [Pirellulaceae bacterium]
MKNIRSWLLWLGVVAVIAAGTIYALLPDPVAVEVVRVRRGLLQVTINEDGVTRVRERYQVSSPVTGQLLRIELRSGDAIVGSETLLATIRPSDPSMLDARQVAETEARASAAKLMIDRADARREQARVANDLAETQFARAKRLRETGAIPAEELEAAEAALRSRQEELRVATFEREIARFEYEQAQAALGLITAESGGDRDFEIRAPIDGMVLRVFQESASVVLPGVPLLEVGNPQDLEVVIDVLSTDAVKIVPGNEIRLLHWGGDETLSATVRVVEPAAFTKISALGVEEQRVNVIGDFHEQITGVKSLGDGYRVEAEIVIWQHDDVVQVPTAALFRSRGRWNVFVVEENRAVQRGVEIGHRSTAFAEVISGLQPGELVVIYPSDQVADGVSAKAKTVENE